MIISTIVSFINYDVEQRIESSSPRSNDDSINSRSSHDTGAGVSRRLKRSCRCWSLLCLLGHAEDSVDGARSREEHVHLRRKSKKKVKLYGAITRGTYTLKKKI